MTYAKLSSIVATPGDELVGLLDEDEAPILDCDALFNSHSTLV